MNSPLESGSPFSSTSSSDSPPPDEVEQTPIQHTRSTFSKFGSTSISGSSKRRLPAGSGFEAASNTREAKSRKKEDVAGVRQREKRTGPDREGWGDEKARRDKDELVDVILAEHLRIDFGDPFMEDMIKNAV